MMSLCCRPCWVFFFSNPPPPRPTVALCYIKTTVMVKVPVRRTLFTRKCAFPSLVLRPLFCFLWHTNGSRCVLFARVTLITSQRREVSGPLIYFFFFFSFSSFEKSVTDPGPVPAGPAGLNSVPACCNQLKVTQRVAICALIGLF